MIRNILRYTVIGIAAAIIGYIGLTVYGEITQTEAVKASEAYQLAQAQAQNMSQALTEVSTFGTTSQQQPAEQSETRSEPVAGQNSIPKSFAGSKGSQDTSSAGNALETQPQPTTPPDIAKITNIDTLITEWQPRYDAAIGAYVKLDASINNAKSRATDYLAQQQALTEQIQNPENQSNARREDEREISLYRQWEAKADSTLHAAAQIGIQLDDMDAYLRKLSLRADFVFDPSQFQDVPKAIVDLNRQLADFQAASENIKAATSSPFEVKQ